MDTIGMETAKTGPFDAHSERYDHWFEVHRAAYISELLALRMLVPWDGHGLEIGVGTGRFAGPLGVAIGLDPSGAMLTRAAARGVETAKGVAEALPFPDRSFDYALVVTTICFVGSPDKMLAEAHRVLRLDGKLIIGFIDRQSGIGRSYLEHQSESVFYREAVFYSAAELGELLRTRGFNIRTWGQTLFRPDVDIHGPSIPKLLRIEGTPISGSENTLYPVKVGYRTGMISVMSIGFLLRERDDAVIWRGPRKYGVIKQFLKDVEWGSLDYLVVDSPPGTGDEPLAVAQLLEKADGALVVTTPQEVAVQDVRRCVVFCRQVNLPVLGVVENMSGFTCPKCGKHVSIFGADGGRIMAEEMGVPYLGGIPIEPEVVASGDSGTPMVKAHPHSETAKAFGRIVRTLLETELSETAKKTSLTKGGSR